jgi:hypothetical protein
MATGTVNTLTGHVQELAHPSSAVNNNLISL